VVGEQMKKRFVLFVPCERRRANSPTLSVARPLLPPPPPFATVGAGRRAKSCAVPAAVDLLLPARKAGDTGYPCAGSGASRWAWFWWRLRSSWVAAAPGDVVATAQPLGGGAAWRPAAALSWPRFEPFWAPSGLGRARSGIPMCAPDSWWSFSC
jgi:hypothetical protein